MASPFVYVQQCTTMLRRENATICYSNVWISPARHITVTSHRHHGVSNHRQLHCLFFNSLSRRTLKETSKLRITLRAIHRWPMNSPNQRPVTGNRFPFDDVVMHKLHVMDNHSLKKYTGYQWESNRDVPPVFAHRWYSCAIDVCFNTLGPRQNGRHFTGNIF